jgi:protocatechuate 3,4-dioxygenase beta subunit
MVRLGKLIANLRQLGFSSTRNRPTPKHIGLLVEELEDRYLLSTIGDFVWNDINGNGLADSGEPGIAHLTVHLLPDGSPTPIQTVLTNHRGVYRFTNVDPGNYQIEIVKPTSRGAGANWEFTTQNQLGSESEDSDADPNGIIQVVVAEGELNLDFDAGLLTPEFLRLATVGKRVWNDLNGNGVQNAGEPGLAGIEVRLIPDGWDEPIQTTTTNSQGLYSFRNIVPQVASATYNASGAYTIQFIAPENWTFSPQDQWSESIDSDVNESGVTDLFTLAPGELNLDIAAGIIAPGIPSIQRQLPARVGNLVWNDLNGDGIFNGGEPPLAGIDVELIDQSTSTVVDSTITDTRGVYQFTNVAPGTYSIRIIAPQDWTFTLQDQGGKEGKDSDADANGVIAPFILGSSAFDIDRDAGLLAPGFVRPAQVGKRVWNDLNGDGLFGAGEQGVANVRVELINESTSATVGATQTDANGFYYFRDVPVGIYTIKIIAPQGWAFTTQYQGGNQGLDSDADANGEIQSVVLAAGEFDIDRDAGLIAPGFAAPARVGNRVWNDINGNGIQDPGEPGLANVKVALIDQSTSTTVATTATNPNGAYWFRDVPSGIYSLQFTAPESWTFTLQDQGGNNRTDSDTGSNGVIANVSLAKGQVDSDQDAGLKIAPPYLAHLKVEGSGIIFNPIFSPTIQRYSINPDSSTNEITITAYAASPSTRISIDGQRVASGESIELSDLAAGDEVFIQVNTPGVKGIGYRIIYLPTDFPIFEVTRIVPSADSNLLYVTAGGYAAILDKNAVPRFFVSGATSDFKRHTNGNYSYNARAGANEFGRTNNERVVLDASLNEIGRYQTVGLNQTDSHDFLILPNGNFVFLSYNGEMRPDPDNNNETRLFEDTVIQVVDPTTNQVVFEWNSKDHIPLSDVLRDDLQEYAHGNALFLDHDGNFLISLRGTSQIVKIDSTTGDVIWKFGGVSSDFAIDDPFGGPCGAHNITRLANGNILLFDNGQYCPAMPEYSQRGRLTRVSEYQLDENLMTAELVWSYSQAGTYTRSGGSADRLSNGNTLVGWSNGPSIFATQVNKNGAKIFELAARSKDGTNLSSYRVVKSST